MFDNHLCWYSVLSSFLTHNQNFFYSGEYLVMKRIRLINCLIIFPVTQLLDTLLNTCLFQYITSALQTVNLMLENDSTKF